MNAELERCDLLITGGEVIDGTGAAARKADIALQGDRIVALGELAGVKADSVIDASGKVVTPGFIDVHTHDDRLLLANPEVTPKLSQGVTTVVVGNCGVSLSPWVSDRTPPPPLEWRTCYSRSPKRGFASFYCKSREPTR